MQKKQDLANMKLLDKLAIKVKKTDIPFTVQDLKIGAETLIPKGEYKQVNDMLTTLKREKILNVKD